MWKKSFRSAKALGYLGAFAALVGACTGAGDQAADECVSPSVVIQSPADGAEFGPSADVDGSADGVQRDVAVRSALEAGAQLSLALVDADGTESVWPEAATVQSDGSAVFNNVTLPAGSHTLHVEGTNECGTGRDTVAVNVTDSVECALVIDQSATTTAHYGNIPVYNATADADESQAGFQGSVSVSTQPDYQVRVFAVNAATGVEAELATATADDTGAAVANVSIADGRYSLRATCSSAGGNSTGSSATSALVADTVAPSCAIVAPLDGTSVIPVDDHDLQTAGTQVAVEASVGDDNLDSTSVVFTVAGTELSGSAVAEGMSSAVATLDVEGPTTVAVEVSDYAANTCQRAATVQYEAAGCSIEFLGPVGVVNADEDGETNGLQTTLTLQVEERCVGQELATTCGVGTRTAVVPEGGEVSLQVTLCQEAGCEVSSECLASVRTAAGNVTTLDVALAADTLAPTPSLDIVNPAIACGTTVTDAVDIDGGVPGVQVGVLGAAEGAATLTVQSIDFAGAATDLPTDLSGLSTVTLAGGLNRFQVRATDDAGNAATTQPCSVTLADIAVAFAAPFNGGVLGAASGTPGDGSLTVDVCGTVSEGAADVAVAINGAAPVAASTDGLGGWCVNGVTLPEQSDIGMTATATLDTRLGSASGVVSVDISGPVAVNDLTVEAVNRHTARAEWTSPADVATYEVKLANEPLNDLNFENTGTALAVTPSGVGAAEELLLDILRPGVTYHVAVRAADAVGNPSPVVDSGSFSVDFTEGAVVTGITDAQTTIGVNVPDAVELGTKLASGDVNDDGFADVIVTMPVADPGPFAGAGLAYLLLGGPNGIESTPQYVFTPDADEDVGMLGRSTAIADWNGDGIDDIILGAPYQNSYSGQVLIYYGGASRFANGLATAIEPQSAADVVITSDGAGFFLFGFLGWNIALADFDGDGRDDLVIDAGYANAEGGVVIVYGGTATSGTNVMSESAASVVGDIVGARISLPDVGDGTYSWIGVYGLGKIDGDGDEFDDIAISNEFEDPEGEEYVFVYRGRTRPVGTFPEISFRAQTDLRLHATRPNVVATRDEVALGVDGVASIPDGSGGRFIVVSEPRKDSGYVYLVPGTTSGEVDLSAVAAATISAGANMNRFGEAMSVNVGASRRDLDMDGKPDLVLAARSSGQIALSVWYGGELPSGAVSFDDAPYQRTVLLANRPDYATWIGDVDGDGLDDFVWADDENDVGGTGLLQTLR